MGENRRRRRDMRLILRHHLTRNWALYLALRLLSVALRFIPLSLAYAIASLAGRIAFYAVRPARRGIERNLTVVFGASCDGATVRKAAQGAFLTDAKNWVDTLRIGRLSAADVLGLVDIEGWEHVESAMRLQKGVIIVALHLGNFDLVGQVFAAAGLNVTIPVERVDPPELFDFLTKSRRSQGVDVVPIEKAPRAIVRALKRGDIVAIAGDRNIAGKTVAVPFFGVTTRVPASPAALARRHGTPVIVAVGTRLPSNRFRGVVVPAPLVFTDDEAFDESANTRRITGLLEPIIRRHADQWLAFNPMWPGDNGTDQAATIGQHTGVAR